MSSALDLNIRTERQLMNSHTSPDRLWILVEYLSVDLVHGSKVVHSSQEDVHFDHIVDATTGSLEDCRKIGKALGLMRCQMAENDQLDRDLNSLTVLSATPPSTILFVFGSIPTLP